MRSKKSFLTYFPPPLAQQLDMPCYRRLRKGSDLSIMVCSLPSIWCYTQIAYICTEGEGFFFACRRPADRVKGEM